MTSPRQFFDALLSWILLTLMVVLTVVVVIAVIYRKAGASLSWYDEIAAILLAWITYYGAALAALRRGHIGVDGVLFALPRPWRAGAIILAEILVIGFFAILAWAGFEILRVLQGDTLVSLTWVPVQITQSVIPIGAVLFIMAELISLPGYWAQMMGGHSSAHSQPLDRKE
jgi:TRAP-type C4-dicarboxylate transport system permease small subunit